MVRGSISKIFLFLVVLVLVVAGLYLLVSKALDWNADPEDRAATVEEREDLAVYVATFLKIVADDELNALSLIDFNFFGMAEEIAL